MKLSEVPEADAPPAGSPAGASQKLSQVGGDAQAPQGDKPDGGSALGALFRGFLQGFQVRDPLPNLPGAQAGMDKVQADTQQQFDQAKQTHPIAATAGDVAGNMAATAPLMGGGAGATLPARVALGALRGGAAAAMTPGSSPAGAGIGAAASAAIPMVGRAIPASLGATLSPEAQQVIAKYPVIGRLVSGAEGRTPENFNVAAVNQALDPIGASAPKNLKAGPGLIQFAKDKYDDAYNALLPKLSLARDPQLTQELGALRQGATDMGDDDLRQFLRNLENRFGKNDGRLDNGLDGRAIKEVEGKLRSLAVDAGKQNKTGLAEHLYEARDRFLDAVERQNPGEAAELKKINQGFAQFARVETAAASAEKGGRHAFTPQELRNASFRSDKSARHGNFARGGDVMQSIANAGDMALSRSQWNPGAVNRVIMPILGAALGFREGGAVGGAAGAGLAAGLPAAVNAARRAPMVAPGARAVGGAVSRAAPVAGRGAAAASKPADRMKASRKVGELKTSLYAAKRKGDLAEVRRLNEELAGAVSDYRKLAPPANQYG